MALEDRNTANDLWMWNLSQQTRERLTVGPGRAVSGLDVGRKPHRVRRAG
jgi:hypothetical protein